METTLRTFLHISRRPRTIRSRRIGDQRYVQNAFTRCVKVDSLLCAEPDDRLVLDRGRRSRNKFGPTNIQYGRCMAWMHHLNWYVGCGMFGSWFLSEVWFTYIDGTS